MPSKVDQKFIDLLEYLKNTRGFDSSNADREKLLAQASGRLQMLEMSDFADYIDYLEVHPEEFDFLFDHLLSARDAFPSESEEWESIARNIIPRIVAGHPADAPIRVWIAGCGSGEEAYFIAMLFAEALGTAEYSKRVKIYATDVKENHLQEARQASYVGDALKYMASDLKQKYFVPSNSHLSFKPELRRSIIFGRHDLVEHAPISHLQLLCCRHVLLYHDAEKQNRILSRFSFALDSGGFLWLGKAASLPPSDTTFKLIDDRFSIYEKINGGNKYGEHAFGLNGFATAGTEVLLSNISFDVAPIAQVIIDNASCMSAVNKKACQLFGLSSKDAGRPLQDLELSYRPLELRSLLEQIEADSKPIIVENIPRPLPDGTTQYLDVQLTPLIRGAELLGVAITFNEVTALHKLQEDFQRSNQELETTNEELQSAYEELETTNEELQSTNEELETTNEELQSTNEELETMNEEVQSTNEELETVNSELRVLTEETTTANTFLEAILTSIGSAIIALDADMKVLVWNHHAEDMWGLRADEVVGKSLFNLDIGLPLNELEGHLKDFVSKNEQHAEVSTAATNRRGKTITCHIRIAPLNGLPRDGKGIILVLDDK